MNCRSSGTTSRSTKARTRFKRRLTLWSTRAQHLRPLADSNTPPSATRQSSFEVRRAQHFGHNCRNYAGWHAEGASIITFESSWLFKRRTRRSSPCACSRWTARLPRVPSQEASVLGSAIALNRDNDWIVPQYRELTALLHHGLPLRNFILYFSGHPAGATFRRACGCCPCRSPSQRSCRRRWD